MFYVAGLYDQSTGITYHVYKNTLKCRTGVLVSLSYVSELLSMSHIKSVD